MPGGESSLSQLPPTAIARPSATPESTRPAASSGTRSAPEASNSEPSAAISGAGSSSARLP
ncbi:Uncharacterised protein [Mycobacteroides abscessus subsp. abscessus]|nr:Uncharacterised protein [Mycobacteroides abscessus subsp. abscessus]